MSERSQSYRPAECHGEDCYYAKKGEPCWGQCEYEDDINCYGDGADCEPVFACAGHKGASVGEPYKKETTT